AAAVPASAEALATWVDATARAEGFGAAVATRVGGRLRIELPASAASRFGGNVAIKAPFGDFPAEEVAPAAAEIPWDDRFAGVPTSVAVDGVPVGAAAPVFAPDPEYAAPPGPPAAASAPPAVAGAGRVRTPWALAAAAFWTGVLLLGVERLRPVRRVP
ncbi:MAG TPA: hypothetical protein VEI02_02175, partial [Planctomycetota bacterium]|nr:hypothetical protein [Planctomycetota bacterium]